MNESNHSIFFFDDDDDRELYNSIENDEWKPIDNVEEMKAIIMEAAKNTISKMKENE
jgi:hypothetical protein